jgi:nucleoside-diphosphate-sugar epimerase
MVGLAILKELRKHGFDTTVFVRPTSDLKDIEEVGADHVFGDVLSPDTVLAAMENRGYDTVISAIARTAGAATDGPVTIYATGNNTITKAARRAGVKQVIQLSTVGSGESRHAVTPEHYQSARTIFRDKSKAEQTLMKIGLDYTIIRTGILLGGPSMGTGMLTEDQTRREPMRVGDVAREAVECVMTASCFGKIFHAVDPSLETLSPEEIQRERSMLNAYKRTRRGEVIGRETQR